MKKLIISFAMIMLVLLGYSQNMVSVETAMNASRNFLSERIGMQDSKGISMTHVYTEFAEDGTPLFYRFQVGEKGFMIVSATDLATPVLAYSLESNFKPGTTADFYCNKYKKQLAYLNENPSAARPEAARMWDKYASSSFRLPAVKDGKGNPCVEPLVTTRWTQETYYNSRCPFSSVPQENWDYRTPVGCVALTMANIMYYYRFPHSGMGAISYIPREYENGELFHTYPSQMVNFSQQTYTYEAMTDQLDKYNGELAKLIYNAGVSVRMSYGHDGSGSQSEYAITALQENFRFSQDAQFKEYADLLESGATLVDWENLAKTELDARRPLFFSGQNETEGGHAWIVDGYTTIDDTLTYFHVNWGWAGSSNGFYLINNQCTSSYGNFNAPDANGRESESMMTLLAPESEDIIKPTTGDMRITAAIGTISDGAGNMKYQPNTSRSWTIATPDATRYSLQFSKLKTQPGDKVIIYNGGTPNSPVLAEYSGNYLMAACNDYTSIPGCVHGDYQGQALPSAVTVNADSVLVVFTTNGDSLTDYGFVLRFEATNITTSGCAAVTAPINTDQWFGVFTDKPNNEQGNDNPYKALHTCSWQLRVPQAAGYALYFRKFDLKAGDFIDIYNTSSNENPIVAHFDAENPPMGVINADASRIQVKFFTDNWLEGAGFEMEFWKIAGIDEHNDIANVTTYPNPVSSVLHVAIEGEQAQNFKATVVDMTGKIVRTEQISFGGGTETHDISVSGLASGFYFLNLQNENGKVIRKFIVE